MPHEIATISECVHCQEKFTGPAGAMGARIIDRRGQNRLGQYLQKLLQHLSDKHPSVVVHADTIAAEYKGMLLISNFTTSDPELLQEREILRWKVHQVTLNCRITDEKIKEKADALVAAVMTSNLEDILSGTFGRAMVENAKSRLHSEARKMLDEMRAILQEPDRYKLESVTAPAAR